MNNDIDLTLRRLECKLVDKLGNDYCGLFSVADYLTNIYCKAHKIKDKNIYFDFILRQSIAFVILKWLDTNSERSIPLQLDLTKDIKKVKRYINKLRKQELYDWISGKTERYIKYLSTKTNLNLAQQYFFDAFNDIAKYNRKKINEFKKEIGL